MPTYQEFLAAPEATRIYLIELEGYDKNTLATRWFYFSEEGFYTEPSDTPPNTYFADRAIRAFSYSISLFGNGRIGGRSDPGLGVVELNNQDGGLDYLRPSNYAFDGRRCVIRLGGVVNGVAMRYSDFGVIYDGAIKALEFGDSTVTVALRDPIHKIDLPLQPTLYGGSGGAEGPVELTGQPKPICLGRVFNAEPVLVDTAKRIYQLHSRSMSVINTVKDQGVAITAGTSRANYAALDSNVPTAGTYDWTNTTTGTYIRLGSTPAGLVTFDGRGDANGSYVETVADLVQRVVVDFGGLPLSGLLTSSFTALNSSNSAPVGFYTSEPVQIPEVLDVLVNSIGAFFTFNRSGQLLVGRITAPSGVPAEIYTDDFGFSRLPTEVPVWRVTLGYQKNHRPMGDADLATSFRPGGVNAASAPALKAQMLYSTTSDAAIKTAHLLAQDLKIDTLLALQADASTEATRVLDLLKVSRDFYRVSVKLLPLARNLGDVVQFNVDRYGLDNGKLFTIVGMSETSDDAIVILDLWG